VRASDPIGDLVNLARAAAESGHEWRAELRGSWLPRLLITTPVAILRTALSEWDGEAIAGGDLAEAIEAAVLAAMAGEGYD
jgi:hypothetical protein